MMMNATELWLVRHGEAEINLGPDLDGKCRGLTRCGRSQAGKLADRLAACGPRFDAAYRSPRLRCAQTAEILTPALGIAVSECDALRNPDHGVAGIDIWDASANAIGTSPTHAPDLPPTEGAEPWGRFLERSGKALLDLLAAHRGQRILVVAHDESSVAAFLAFSRLPPAATRWLYAGLDHTGISRWRLEVQPFDGAEPHGQFTLLAHNDREHLIGS
jgi:probable phosphoglycerate mutase